MPVQKISDAPANIRELDDVKLTLAQVNWILRVYDGLKEEEQVESPMAVAISQFKKSYHKDGDKWVKNKETAAVAATINLEHLERYIVVQVGDLAAEDVGDLRELEGDFPQGVHALWSDEHQTIIAFAFEPAHYEQAEAEAWVKEHIAATIESELARQPAGMREWLLSLALSALRLMAPNRGEQVLGDVSARSFDDTQRLVSEALMQQFGSKDQDTGQVIETPWIVDIGPHVVIFEWRGQQYAAQYTIGLDDAVTLGDMAPVKQEWIQRADGSPIMLHALAYHLGDDGEIEDDDSGLIWKEIMRPGTWYQATVAEPVQIEITADMVKAVYEAFEDGLPQFVSVPVDSHFKQQYGIVPPDRNTGFVRKLQVLDGARLFGGFEFTEPAIDRAVQVGNIADVSVYLRANVPHPESGTVYPWTLRHVLLTNNPLLQGLEGFGVLASIAAESGPDRTIVVHYRQEDNMSDTQGNGQDTEALALLAQYRELGPVEDLQALMVQREELAGQVRDMQVSRILLALEGKEELEGVTQVAGSRHYPAIVAAVETALKGAGDLALEADAAGATSLDSVILAIVNALPAEARLSVAADAGPRAPLDPLSTDDTRDDRPPLGPGTVPDEAIEALDDSIGGRHTAPVGG